MKPIKISPPPAAAPIINRPALADRIGRIRILANACLSSVVRSGVMRSQGIAVSQALTERASALQYLLEQGADDRDFVPYMSGLEWLELDAHAIATDPHAVQAQHDERATGRAASAPLGEVEANAP